LSKTKMQTTDFQQFAFLKIFKSYPK